MLKNIFFLLIPIAVTLTTPTLADEGQWQPHQLLELKPELKKIGLTMPAEKLSDLKKAPLNAIVSLGGCSASFVSPKGLIVTNHHCAYGDIQQNANATNDLIAKGFLAKTRAEELPGSPSSRVYVTDKVENVTDRVLKGLAKDSTGLAYYEEIQKRIKSLIAECEEDRAYRCSVPSFHRGLEYYRIRQLMIRDVRLVYAPSDRIGNFGGETDNFEWPRHTGDFSFLRAYVGKDGRPADPSPDNVPYASSSFLAVSAEGLKQGDPIFLAGYPGRTSRYKLPVEIRDARDISLPRSVAEAKADLYVIDKTTQAKPESVVRYASVAKSIKNRLKKSEGLLDGFARKDIAAIKDAQDIAFRTWLSHQADASAYKLMLADLDILVAKDLALAQEQFAWSVATNSELLKNAQLLYRLALEKKLPDADRESGYQERDVPFIKSRQARLEQTLVKDVDRDRWIAALARYHALPAATHPRGLDELLPKASDIDRLYEGTKMDSLDQRLASLNLTAADWEASKDSLSVLAVKFNEIRSSLENRRKEIDGNLDRLIPQMMKAMIAWKRSLGKPVYPDANSTLRVTFGTVAPYAPVDGVVKGPFTTLEGVLAKSSPTQKDFLVTEAFVAAARSKKYGPFRDSILGTVPVNFLSTVDTTGGNSGSAVMNKRGELVGLNFDSTYESVTKDWYFDDAITRAIQVDIRYMLWVMTEVDKADVLLKELTVKYPKRSP